MPTTNRHPLRIGALLWPQTDSWSEICNAARTLDAAGLDSIWTWDHLMAIVGRWEQPILEGWTLLAGLAAVTQRPTLGLMVGANTFRNPGLTTKLATTLDHISNGRAYLGIGGAWFQREHEGYGIDFGSGFGERLDRLDEAVMLMRRLLDGERIDRHEGKHYTMVDALCEPRPIQQRLPILIGGSGPQKTLRTTARYADAWNTAGSVEDLRRKDGTLRERCAEVGRDPDEIERTVTFDIVIRDDPKEARRVMAAGLEANGTRLDNDDPLVGPPEKIADRLRPTVELGFRHILIDSRRPYDLETLERLAEVKSLLAS